MPYLGSWEEFSRAAELLYTEDPAKARVVLKYRHQDGKLVVKVTDNALCLMYLADQAQDLKRVDKLVSQLMRLTVAKDTQN